jgi:hypothetical protein
MQSLGSYLDATDSSTIEGAQRGLKKLIELKKKRQQSEKTV